MNIRIFIFSYLAPGALVVAVVVIVVIVVFTLLRTYFVRVYSSS